MKNLEPIRHIDLTLYTLPGAGKAALKELQPKIDELLRRAGSLFELKPGDGSYFLLCWRNPVKIGEFEYKPLAIRIATQEENRLPQLAFIKGLPVLDLRYLASEYRRRCASIDELGARTVLSAATTAVSEILSGFEF